MREGTLDVLKYVPAITALWHAKNITPKQHYSEPRHPQAIIRRDLRPHSRRVYNLPPCDPTMDLMIEAKDKEQAVFALRRKWNVEGGLPKEWIMNGDKLDEDREVPSEMGTKVFYEEGEEWRFKAPLKIPARVLKLLDKLEKQKATLGDDDTEKLKKLEAERKSILEDWEREKRIKWGLEKGAELGNELHADHDVDDKTVPRNPSVKKSKAIDEEFIASKTILKTRKTKASKQTVQESDEEENGGGIMSKGRKSITSSAKVMTAAEHGARSKSSVVATAEMNGGSKRRRTSRKL